MSCRVVSRDPALAAAVRAERRSPQYGHPAVAEVSTGTCPCRSCLRPFAVGHDERLLFTYRPDSGDAAVGAPGPVFIHAATCDRFEGTGFPEGLLGTPIVVEGRTRDGRVVRADPAQGEAAETLITACLGNSEVDFAFLRHGEAGCHIARVERAP